MGSKETKKSNTKTEAPAETAGPKTSEYKMMKAATTTAACVAVILGCISILCLFGAFTPEQAKALESIVPPMIAAVVLLVAGIYGAGVYTTSRGNVKSNRNNK